MGLTLRVTDGLTLVKVVTLSSSLITWQTRKKQKKRKNDAVRWLEEEKRTENKEKIAKYTQGIKLHFSTDQYTLLMDISLTQSRSKQWKHWGEFTKDELHPLIDSAVYCLQMFL